MKKSQIRNLLLKFTPLIKLVQIEFNSMEMYADEKEAKIYFVYQGHLLSIPLPKDAKKQAKF